MSTPILSTHRSLAVLARRQLTASSRTVHHSRTFINDSKNDGPVRQDEKPKQERLEDIFADLFDENPLPSLRPPPSETNIRPPREAGEVVPSWIQNSPSVETPRRSSSSGWTEDQGPSSTPRQTRSRPPSSGTQERRPERRPRFGMRQNDEPGRSTDRSRMTLKETKAFNEILGNMYEDHTASKKSSAPSTSQSDIPVRPISARLGYLDPEDRSTSTHDRPTSERTPRPVRPTMPAHEVGQETYDEFDRQKEIISGLGSDLEVWAWVRENVFRTTPRDVGPGEDDADRQPFPSSYSLVLAYLIKVFREELKNPHLALSTFTLARSHSIQSYVAGCSTAAYNEAMETYWKSFRNLRRVEECVKEMSVNGVGWDRNTSKILSSIIESLSETQLSSPAAQFGAGQRRLEAEFGTEVLIRLGALEKRVEADVKSKEKGVRMLLGQLAAEKRRREAASRPADLLPVQDEPRWEDERDDEVWESGRGRDDRRSYGRRDQWTESATSRQDGPRQQSSRPSWR